MAVNLKQVPASTYPKEVLCPVCNTLFEFTEISDVLIEMMDENHGESWPRAHIECPTCRKDITLKQDIFAPGEIILRQIQIEREKEERAERKAPIRLSLSERWIPTQEDHNKK